MEHLKKNQPLLLTTLLCAVLFCTFAQYGVVWDDGPYIYSGETYFKWFKNPSFATIDTYWQVNSEHPPLHKVLGGFCEFIFYEKLNIVDKFTAFRISTLLFVFVFLLTLYSFTCELYGSVMATCVTLSFFFLPRVFFHAHLATLDYSMATMWFLVIYTYWKGMKNQKWLIVSSCCFGLALLSKLNGLFLYIPIGLCWLLHFHDRLNGQPPGKDSSQTPSTLEMYSKLIIMFIIPLILFVLLWPWLWKDPIARILEYISFHKGHQEISVYYLGKKLSVAPWHYPFVLTAVTTPLVVLLPFFAGLFNVNGEQSKAHLFIFFNALYPLLIIALPGVPKFDGIRLFLPAFPFICILSALGVRKLFCMIPSLRQKQFFILSYFLACTATVYASVVKVHPYHSAYFNEIIGGVDGAQEKGFEITYWANSYKQVLPWMNKHKESTFWIYTSDIDPDVQLGFFIYKDIGLLDKTVRLGNKQNSDYLILLNRKGFFNDEMWDYYTNKTPVFSVKLDNTDLVGVYKL